MKTQILLLATIFFTIHSYAQKSGDFELGLFAGLSLSSVSSNEALADVGPKLGLNVGLFGNYFFSEQWGLRTKIYYDQKGFDNVLLAATNSTTKEGSITFHNVTIPLMANFNFGNNNSWFINAGPYVSQLLSAQASEGVSEQKNQFNKTDIGAEGGFGYKFSLSKRNKKVISI